LLFTLLAVEAEPSELHPSSLSARATGAVEGSGDVKCAEESVFRHP